jgi:hypothetical protein
MRIPRLMNRGAGRWRTVAQAPEIQPQEVLMRPSVSRIPTVVVGIDTATVTGAIACLTKAGCRTSLGCSHAAGAGTWNRGRRVSTTWSSRVLRPGARYGKLWRPECMHLELVGPDWLPQTSFWSGSAFSECRIGLVDVPFAPIPTGHFSGVYVNGWHRQDGTVHHIAPTGL